MNFFFFVYVSGAVLRYLGAVGVVRGVWVAAVVGVYDVAAYDGSMCSVCAYVDQSGAVV